jgi:7-cyano-7-deazaguanine synthase in queuosine biosynthesis
MTKEIPDYLGKERVHEREKWWRDTDVGTRREETGMYWMEGKERRCRMCYEERRDNRAYVEWMRRNERDGEKGTGRHTE